MIQNAFAAKDIIFNQNISVNSKLEVNGRSAMILEIKP